MRHMTVERSDKMAGVSWLVGKVEVDEEFRVARRLRRLGLKVMCPAYLVTVRPAKRRSARKRPKPAYPGYLFICCGVGMDLEQVILDVPGFYYIVSFDNEYSECSDSVLRRAVSYIRELEGRGVLAPSTPAALVQLLLLGAFVKVSGGPAGGRYGTIEDMKDNRVLLTGEDFPKPAWISADRVILQNTGS